MACVSIFIIECLQVRWEVRSEDDESSSLSSVTHNDDSRSATQDETSKSGTHSDGSRESFSQFEEGNIRMGI